ncbi:MAG: MCE family protein [Planctomycetes bacterium]|nr:MCE family protein [Planctomycetota bacterium]
MSDYETAERKRNIIVGIFVVGSIGALLWLIFQFRDLPGAWTKFNSFQVFVRFPTAPGVQKDTPVQFCGYQIGRVANVMYPEPRRDLNTGLKYHQTLVVLSIDKKHVNIPSNVEVKLMTRGLGSSYIDLKVDPIGLPAPPLDPNRPETQFLVDEMHLQGSTGITSEFFPEESQKKLELLVDKLSTLSQNLNEVVGDPNSKHNFKSILANLSVASRKASNMFEEFRTFSVTGTTVLKSLEKNTDKFVTSIVATSEELGKTLAEMRVTLEKVNSGQGSVGKLVNDAQLYESLVETSEEMRKVLEELRTFLANANEKGSVPIKLK